MTTKSRPEVRTANRDQTLATNGHIEKPTRATCVAPPTQAEKASATSVNPSSSAVARIESSPQSNQSQSETGDHKEHRHTGKVGRLPKEIRDQISQMILDGVSYKEIIAQAGPPVVGLTESNLSNWKTKGGLDEYVQEQHRLYECRARYEFLDRLAKQDTGTSNYQASPKLALAMIADALAEIGPETLRKGMKEDSRNAVRLLNTLARILGGGLRCEKHLLDVADRQAQTQNQTSEPRKGLSKGTKDEILEELNLL